MSENKALDSRQSPSIVPILNQEMEYNCVLHFMRSETYQGLCLLYF